MELIQSLRIFRALSDPSRLLIINSLINKAQYVEEIASRLNLSESTVSFHLNKLEDADLVYKVKDQYYTMLHLNTDILGLYLKELISFTHNEKSSQEERLKTHSEKVISTYFNKGKLLKIPSQHKKRIIILEAVLSMFEPEKVYQEQEVDLKIKEIFDDHCTIRRYLIDEKMMFRKKGKYSLNENYKFDSLLPEKPLQVSLLNKKRLKKENLNMNDRTKIKNQYKLTPRPMGVYQLKDLKNNKIYLGVSKNLDAIFNRHRFELNTGIHQVKEVQESWNKSGEKGIMLEVLENLKPVDDLTYDYTDDLKTLLELWEVKLAGGNIPVYILNGTMIKKQKK